MLRPSKKLAYWVGVVQSDGYLKKYRNKISGNVACSLSFDVSESSLPMLKKFQELSSELFNRNASIFKRRTRYMWTYHIGVNNLLSVFERLDIHLGRRPEPPAWCIKDPRFFGAYLAGLIDGDGDIRVKRKRYPQCVIRITSGREQLELANAIGKILRCSVAVIFRRRERILKGRKIRGTWYKAEFYVSSKNHKFVKQFVLPHLMLLYKKEKLQAFIANRCRQRKKKDSMNITEAPLAQ